MTGIPEITDYLQNTVPWGKQTEAFHAALDPANTFGDKLFALFMEQRTGKTPVALALLAYQYEHGHVDAALITAMPSGVPQNWADEIDGNPAEGKPARFPVRIKRMIVVWDARRAATRQFQQRLADLLAFDGLAILLLNGEAVTTTAFRKFAPRFLRKRKVYGMIDETSLVIKSPGGPRGSKRTGVLNGVRPLTTYRLILDGTPAGESPLDLYSQVGWLSNEILGHATHQSFKHHYAAWEMKTYYDKTKKVTREYPAIQVDEETGRKMYQHLDEMQERLAGISFICKRRDCFDIPDKLYTPYHFDLSTEQRRVYDELRGTYEAELSDGGAVSAKMVLTRYLRLQQVGSNFWPSERQLALCDDCRGEGCESCDGLGAHVSRTVERVIDPSGHPRFDALADVLSVNRDPVVVWARFTHDIDEIMRGVIRLGRYPVRYDGRCDPEEKHRNKSLFQSGKADLLAANQQAAQRGLDFSAAQAHVYYSNTFSGLQRQQTEDRTEVAGRARGTGVIDLAARDTVDEIIAAAHLEKRSVAEIIMTRPPGRRLG